MIDLSAIKQRLAAASGEHRHEFVAHAEEDVRALVAQIEKLSAVLGAASATVEAWAAGVSSGSIRPRGPFCGELADAIDRLDLACNEAEAK